MAGVKGVPVIPTAGVGLYATSQRRPCHADTGVGLLWQGSKASLSCRHRSRTLMAGVKGVPVIPTAGVGLYGRGQRLEGSLVEESVGQARGR